MSFSQASMASPAATYPAPWTASTGMIPAERLRIRPDPRVRPAAESLAHQIGTEYIAALGVAIVLATPGLNGVPMVTGQYRERGISCAVWASRRCAR